MPNPISGGYQVPGDLGQRLKGTENAVAQLQRLMMKPPKPEKATPGGFVGVAEVMSQTGTVSVTTDALNANSVRYNAPYDPFGSGADISWLGFDSANPSRFTLEVGGWYSALMEIHLEWANPSEVPSHFNPIIYFGGAGHDWDQKWAPTATPNSASGGYPGVYDFLDIGPIYAQDAFTVLQAQLRLANATGTALGEASIAWKITRWA